MLAHNVYFSLNDSGDQAVSLLIDDCHKYLAPLPGIVFYAAGRLAGELDRDVNDRDFHVALHVVFSDRAALEEYLHAPAHIEFIDKHSANWVQVRVFDSHVTAAEG